jgi:predicted deacetylase
VTAHLIVSLSGLSDDVPASLDAAADFAARLDARGVPLSQLVRPRGPAGVPSPDSRLVRWLHGRREIGDAIVLHGYDHHRSPAATRRLRGRRAEFATLPRHEAGLRLIAARRALTEFSLRTDVFVPPHWLASHGTVEALREQGFRVLADENGIRFLRLPAAEGLRSRVLTFRAAAGERDPAVGEVWRCRVLVAEVARTTRRGGLVRINVRAKDLRRPPRRDAVLAAVDTALAEGAVPETYRMHARPARVA